MVKSHAVATRDGNRNFMLYGEILIVPSSNGRRSELPRCIVSSFKFCITLCFGFSLAVVLDFAHGRASLFNDGGSSSPQLLLLAATTVCCSGL
jgi:hypothetical protein